MRGRTNILSSGGGASINGKVERYEITGGAITEGDFVQFYSQSGDYDTFSGKMESGYNMHPNKVRKIAENKFVVLYIAYPSGSSTGGSNIIFYLSLVDISNGLTILNTVNVANTSYQYADFDVLSDGTIAVLVYPNGDRYMIRYKINDSNEFEEISRLSSNVNGNFIVALGDNRIVTALTNGTNVYAYLYSYDENTITYLTQFSSTISSGDFETNYGIGIGALDNSTVLFFAPYYYSNSKEAPGVLQYEFAEDESTCSMKWTRIGSTGAGWRYNYTALSCGYEALLDKNMVFVRQAGTYGLGVVSVSTGNNPTLMTSIATKTTNAACIGRISENRIIVAQPAASTNNLTFEIMDIDQTNYSVTEYDPCEVGISSNSCGYGFFLIDAGNVYYIGCDGTNSVVVKLTIKGTMILEGTPMIMPYDSIIAGVAKGTGVIGDTIEIYVPNN